MNGVMKHWQFLLAGLYTWIATTFFGATLLDIVYARLASRTLQLSETAPIFSEIADFLLLIGALTVVTSFGAVGSAWGVGFARNLYIASLVCVIAPIWLYWLIAAAQADLGINIGMWVRLATSALSSVLAFVGLWKLYPTTL